MDYRRRDGRVKSGKEFVVLLTHHRKENIKVQGEYYLLPT